MLLKSRRIDEEVIGGQRQRYKGTTRKTTSLKKNIKESKWDFYSSLKTISRREQRPKKSTLETFQLAIQLCEQARVG